MSTSEDRKTSSLSHNPQSPAIEYSYCNPALQEDESIEEHAFTTSLLKSLAANASDHCSLQISRSLVQDWKTCVHEGRMLGYNQFISQVCTEQVRNDADVHENRRVQLDQSTRQCRISSQALGS